MVTKAIVQSINPPGNRCIVRMPLFETAANPNPVEAEALVNIAPGMFNSLEVGDIVFVAFEENALEKPIIIGKLFRGTEVEGNIRGGGGVLDALNVRTSAVIPSSTYFEFPKAVRNSYKDLNTPKKTADYVKWLEKFTKQALSRQDDNFRCFKNWTQWQFKPENVEIDDGDLDTDDIPEPFLYQEENYACRACENCTKANKRNYTRAILDKNYPDI